VTGREGQDSRDGDDAVHEKPSVQPCWTEGRAFGLVWPADYLMKSISR
jgi:hypothetical protein